MGEPGRERRTEDGEPSLLLWLVATISLVLPWIAAALAIWGTLLLAAGDRLGWLLLGSGLLLFAIDVVVDLVWANPAVMTSDDPNLNRRGEQLVGRAGVVVEPIVGGRGRVRLGDTLWTAEGADAPEGAIVRVTEARGTVLLVEVT